MTTKPACLRFVTAAIALIATVASSAAQTLIWPVDAPRVTQDYASYGGVIASKFHTGIDITSAISAANNTQVLAAGAGTVIMANNTCTAGNTTCGSGWGNYVVIRHNSGLFTLYAHMFSVSVSVGASVAQGQVIGIMGATGNVTGAHIHFDILTSQPSTTSDFGPGYTTDHPANLGHPDPRDYIQRYAVTVNTAALSVRKKPSATETLVTTVSQGQQFIALAQSANGWYFIFLPSSVIPSTSTLDDNRYGWVSGSFLIVNPSPSPAQVKVSGTLLWSGGATSLRVRSGAGTGFGELTKVWGGQSFVTFGTPTTGTGSTLPWYKIHLPANAGATEGWVAGDYLSVSGTTTPTRIISLSGNLDFGVVEVGSSAQRTLTIANTGNSTLTVSSISYPSGFSGSWSGTIAAGSSQNVTVTFSPNGGIGPYAGTVTVNSDKTSGGNTIFASGTGGLTPTRIISLSGNLAFGNVTVGSSAQSTLNIANTGNSTLTVSSISYPSGFSGSWSGTIAAGSSQNVTVTFSPSAATSYGGTVTVNSDKTSGVNTIAASGTGTPAPTRIISLSGNLAFGNVTVGSSAQTTLTIANNGNSTMTVSSISYPSGFSGNWSSGTIAAGGSQNVTVTFSPSAATSYGGTVTVNANQTSGGNTIAASGTGIAAPTRIISLSGNLAFGNVTVGSSAQSTLTIANNGNSTMTVSSISYPSGFSGAWSGTIPAGGSQNVTVTFSPSAATSYGGTVTVNANQTSGGNTIAASGTGTITPTRIISLSGDLAFGSVVVGSSVQRTLTIANNGNSTMTVSSISYPSGFSGNWASGTIVAGGSQNVTVTFSPSAAASYGGTVTVNANQTSGANTIAATGTGTITPTRIISLSGDLAFGSVVVGSSAQRTLTIANTGNSTLTVSSVSYPSGFSGAWSGTIAAGGSQNVTVTFSPTAATSYGGTVTVNSDKTSGVNTIAASGTGTITPTRIISLSGDLAFGNVTVGSSAQRTLTIANSGNSTMTVSSVSYPSGFSGNWASGTIPAGGSQNVTVTFSPTAATSYGGAVTVNSDKTSGANTITASGTGTPVSDGVVFFDDMESGQGTWGMNPPWGLTTASSHSASHAWTDSPGGNYPNNTNVSLSSPLIDLTGKSAATLTFWHHFDFAAGDAGYIWVLPQGGSFTTSLRSFSGTDLSWHQESIDLSNYVGQVVTVYFQLLSDASGVADGWYVDDVAVTASTQKQLTGMSLSNGVFRFVLNGPVGSNYVIQVSSNLVNWLPLSTNIVPAGGAVTITDSSMSTLPRRFYRAIPQTAGATPSNDLFADRIVITGNNVTVSGSNIAATMESGEPFHWSSTGGKSVWWSWQAPSSGVVTISTAGSSFDTVLAAYTGNSVGGLTLVQNNDDFGGNLTSQVSFAATSGTVYQIAVDGFGGASGTTSLSLSQP